MSKAIGPLAAQKKRVAWETFLIISFGFVETVRFFFENNVHHRINHQEKNAYSHGTFGPNIEEANRGAPVACIQQWVQIQKLPRKTWSPK